MKHVGYIQFDAHIAYLFVDGMQFEGNEDRRYPTMKNTDAWGTLKELRGVATRAVIREREVQGVGSNRRPIVKVYKDHSPEAKRWRIAAARRSK